jgi:hypothetical protein
MRFPPILFLFLSFFLLAAGLSAAQDIDSTSQTAQASTPIQDNSFLIEEDYNQEDRVIQQISTFERPINSRDWVYTIPTNGRCEATGTRGDCRLCPALRRSSGSVGCAGEKGAIFHLSFEHPPALAPSIATRKMKD